MVDFNTSSLSDRAGHRRPRLAVMGAGRWGTNWIRVVDECPDAELSWVIDSDSTALNRVAEMAPCATLSDRIAAAIETVDGAVVCTAARDHVAHVRALVEVGKHVLVEKPFAMDTAQARALVALARERKTVLMVGHQLMFHPAFNRLQALLGTGRLGRVRSLRVERTGLIDFNREPDVLWTYGPHDMALLLTVIGRPPTQTHVRRARFDSRDVLQSLELKMTFQTGQSAEVKLCGATERRVRRLWIVGERGTALFDDAVRGGRLLMLDADPASHRTPSGEIELERGEPLARELIHFIQCVRSGDGPLTGGAHAIEVTHLLEQLSRQLATTEELPQAGLLGG